jgi:hypothetical protein
VLVAPGSFTNDWFFSLNSPVGLTGSVVTFDLLSFDIKGLTVELTDTTTSTTYYGPSGVTTFSLNSLPSGPYELIVKGDATGSSGGYYSGGVQAVPLPAAAWLLLSGLGGVGVLARRRRVDNVA